MEARTVNNLPPAGTHDDAVRCVLAIELSKKSWIVAVNTPLSDKISRHTVKPCDGKELAPTNVIWTLDFRRSSFRASDQP
jgi:transposase